MQGIHRAAIIAACATFGCVDAELMLPEFPEGCAAARACQVTGIDLVVDAPVLVVDDARPRDALSGWPVFMPGEAFTYVVTVWNRGDTRSAATTLAVPSLSVAVPALDPGEVFTYTAGGETPESMDLQSDSTTVFAGLTELQPGEDPLHGNDSAHSDYFRVALPVLELSVTMPDTVRVEVPFAATITIENVSRFGDLEPHAMALCLLDYDVGCRSTGVGEYFALTDVPHIDAGDSWTTEIMVSIPVMDDYYMPWDWDLLVCFQDAGSGLDAFQIYLRMPCRNVLQDIDVLGPVEPASARIGGAS